MLLMIDNYDSFTYNLVRYCEELGVDMLVRRNDEITLAEIEHLAPQAILLSPGPCTPLESGICIALVQRFAGIIPILGICLGHQVICHSFGGAIIRAKQIVHGKTSKLFHKDISLFSQLPQGYNVTRYHSLVADTQSLPECLEVLAWTLDEHRCFEEIMAVRHRQFELYGVQFHPEALLTEHGHFLLSAFLQAQGISVKNMASIQGDWSLNGDV